VGTARRGGASSAARLSCSPPNRLPEAAFPRYSHARNRTIISDPHRSWRIYPAKTRPGTAFRKTARASCTKSGHSPVDRLHSIENTNTYRRRFFVDSRFRRSKTGSFFDTFLSFSGWCGVRGSSVVTFLIERLGGRASEGLKQSAGRGEREDQVRGRIEFRGVGLVYPVGGEPGAQAKIARCAPQGRQR